MLLIDIDSVRRGQECNQITWKVGTAHPSDSGGHPGLLLKFIDLRLKWVAKVRKFHGFKISF